MQRERKHWWICGAWLIGLIAAMHVLIPSAAWYATAGIVGAAAGCFLVVGGGASGRRKSASVDEARARQLIGEFRELLDGAVHHLTSQHDSIRTDIKRIQTLLAEAIEQLTEGFSGMHAQ